VPLTVNAVRRIEVSGATASQAPRWTLLEFEVSDGYADRLATALAGALEPGAWYVDFHSAIDTFVVFAGRIFRYPRGDVPGREAAEGYARSLGVPDHQLDWPD